MTRLTLAFALIAGLLVAAGTLHSSSAAILGDANCDGSVDSVDATIILQYSAGLLPKLACSENADAFEDGSVDSRDALLILQFSAGLTTSLVPGVTSTEVILGTHASLTGPIAVYRVIPQLAKAYFDHINATENGVNGRKITYLQKDDAYNSARAVELTRELVEQDHIFAMFNALGTPNHLQVTEFLRANGVPDMFVATGATQWVADPATWPLTFGSSPNYTGEGLALGKWILDHKAPGVNVGVIYEDDDFGRQGLAGLRLALGDSIVDEERYEVTDPDLSAQIQRLQALDVDVIATFAAPLLLSVGIRHARDSLDWDVQFVIDSAGMNELTGLITGSENIEGTVGPVTTYMAYQTSIPAVQAHQDLVIDAGITRSSQLTLYAHSAAELMVETLRRAGLALTREGLVNAAESIKAWKCSVCLFPVTLGPNDHDPAQSVAMGVFQNGRIVITDAGYSWEGVPVDDLSLDTISAIDVPADAQSGS